MDTEGLLGLCGEKTGATPVPGWHSSHALWPTVRLTFSGFGLGISVVSCRLGVGLGVWSLEFRGSWVFLHVMFLGILEAMFFELGVFVP